MFTLLFLFLAVDDAVPVANPMPAPATTPAGVPDQPPPAVTPDPPPPPPVQPAPVAAPIPEPQPAAAKPDADSDELRSRVTDLESKLKALSADAAAAKAEAKAARERADRAYDEAFGLSRYHSGAGLGVLAPLGAGGAQFGVNANLHWLTAQWVPAAGIGLGIAPTIEIWRVRLRVFDLGVFYDYGTPLTVPDIQRKLDITLASGIDVRVWKGLALHTQIGWFLPNPVSLYNAASAQYDAAQGMGGGSGTLGGAISSIGDAKSAGQYALNRFADACKAPMLTVAVDWQF